MDSLLSPEQDRFNDAAENSSLDRLLESGLLCVRQGHYREGFAFFALARERLSPDKAQIIAVLDALIQSHTSYMHTREELLYASKQFARADSEQQEQLATLQHLLSTMPKAMKKISTPDDDPKQYARKHPLLRILQPLSSNRTADQSTEKFPSASAGDLRGGQALSQPPVDFPPFPGLYITCFGHFTVNRRETPVVLCANRHGQTILRYLIAHAEHGATSDTLMALLWPEGELAVVQPRLHTSISALRHSLNAGYTSETGGGYIVCKNRTYCLNPEIPILTDVEQFLSYYRAGRESNDERSTLYEKACQLYTGPFLTEDTYADWSSLQREHLCRLYIDMCRILSEHYLKTQKYEEAEEWANAILKENRCDELAHRQLMYIYASQGRRSDVFQQYQRCERVLSEELAVPPLPETLHIVQVLLNSDSSSAISTTN